MIIGRNFAVKINANIGNSAVVLVHRRRSGEAAMGDLVGRRHRDGSLDRPRHPRDARVDPPQLGRPDRHRADLPGAGESRRPSRRADLGDLSRHADRAGGAGRRLLHRPCRRPAALHPDDGAARHRIVSRGGSIMAKWCLAHHQENFTLHALPRDLRDHARLRRLVLARRRPAAGIDCRRERRAAVRRAEDAGRADEDRVGVRRPGDERRPRPRADAPHSREHGEAARVVRRGAVLHAWAAHHRHRSRATITSRRRSAPR